MNGKSIKRRAKYLTTLSSSSLPVSLHSLDTNAHTHSWIIKQCQTWLSGTILWQDLTKMVTRYFVHFCTMTVHVSAGHESAHPNNRMFQRRHGLRDTAWGKGLVSCWAVDTKRAEFDHVWSLWKASGSTKRSLFDLYWIRDEEYLLARDGINTTSAASWPKIYNG